MNETTIPDDDCDSGNGCCSDFDDFDDEKREWLTSAKTSAPEYRDLAEKAVVALHIHFHAGFDAPLFDDCRKDLCGQWHRLKDKTL